MEVTTKMSEKYTNSWKHLWKFFSINNFTKDKVFTNCKTLNLVIIIPPTHKDIAIINLGYLRHSIIN